MKEDSKSKEYIVNTIILLIGKFVTQFMSFLLLPLYTHYLNTDDYGLVDIIQTYETLLIPIFTLRLDSAIFRFLIDERKNEEGQRKIISTSIALLIVEIIVFLVLALLTNIIFKINYFYLVLLNIPAIMISNVLLQLVRGLGKNKTYSIACIITGVLTLLINIILICGYECNAGSILISSTIANIACSIYLLWEIKLKNSMSLKNIDRKKLKEMLQYSLPMIPNSMSWWIVNASDRTIISLVIDVAANGIYSVACKFSNILNSIFTIFNMSWQETAALHINEEDCDSFFSDMINRIFHFFTSISIMILVTIPLAFKFLIGDNYENAYLYIPIVLFANIFNVLINLIGGIYVAKKESKKLASTTLISAGINIIVNLLFIKKFGLYAAAFSTFVAYFAVVIYRYIDVQKYLRLKLDIKKFLLSIFMFLVLSCSYYANIFIINIVSFLIAIIFSIVSNKYLFEECIKFIKNKFKKENG